jgi:hypothetical protein
LPPLLCFGGFLGWHGAVIWRERSKDFLCLWYLCGKWNKNDDSTVSITNTGCIRRDN